MDKVTKLMINSIAQIVLLIAATFLFIIINLVSCLFKTLQFFHTEIANESTRLTNWALK
jgi:hypothetical protein